MIQAHSDTTCSHLPFLLRKVCTRWQQIWYEGSNDLYFTGYAWHNRYTYDRARIRNYNEAAWGSGIGRGLYDEDRDWHGLYAMAFLDSHQKVEPAAGYAFLKMLHKNNFHLGAGYGLILTARPDIFKGRPFPGILPWASIGFRQINIAATYIPGSSRSGNVLFAFIKWTFADI